MTHPETNKDISFYIPESTIAASVRHLDDYITLLRRQGFSYREPKLQSLIRTRAELKKLHTNLISVPKQQVLYFKREV